ncbi:polysaccharide deacetylase family protein [Legionella sp. W05-934-2]|jgi:peptidoglycan/xylan/chitin deacetylase (PgdA/CDA1 family)|uniref:polysaccharide deacetylase family protein n=1 Tax=Legionella sp. W05-934-2 TaxID=1198649 RepID=UPI0034620099
MKRNLIGYGPNPPDYDWPNGAKVAVNFVLNYEEGAELTPVNGDDSCENYGGEFPLSRKEKNERSLSMESLYEYGSRAGVWRLLRLFEKNNVPLTLFATGLALQLNPPLCQYLTQKAYDIAGHGWRWIDQSQLSAPEEKRHMIKTIATIEQLTNQRIKGWYSGRKSNHTRRLLKEIGGFLYDSDSYADDIPYYDDDRHLIIPYNLVTNDFRFCTQPGFSGPADFYLTLKNTLDYLVSENRWSVMTIGLHPRISGYPARAQVIKEFLNYLKSKPNVWVCRRVDIAQFCMNHL